jgi:hypothetical protein
MLRFDNHDEGQRVVLPILVDLKRCKPDSERHVYACILHYLCRSLQRGRVLKDNSISKQLHTISEGKDSLSFFTFEDTLEDMTKFVEQNHGSFRLILLLDEIEAMTRYPWSEILFNQLRALIYDGPLADAVKLVLTGSVKVVQVRHEGSPLLNAVKIAHLKSLSEHDLGTLIARGEGIPDDVSSAIQAQSGRHPFIAQYLMHHLWDDNGLTLATPAQVERVARQMQQQRAADLQGWWEAIGDSGQQAYAVLAAKQDWMGERTLLTEIHSKQPLGQGLAALCYHGLAIRDESRQHYHVVGKLFLDWFALNCAERLAKTTMPSEKAQIIIEHLEQHIGAQTNIGGNVNGPVASGQFESATAIGGEEAKGQRGCEIKNE